MQKLTTTFCQATLAGLICTLAACGGGSSTPVVTQTLSADQAIFENLILSPSSSYALNWSLPNSGTPISGTHYLATSHATLAASPLTNGTQKNTNTAYASLASTIGLPANFGVTRYLRNGQIIAASTPAISAATYSGTSIKIDSLAADGATVLKSGLRSSFSSVPLSGLVNAAPTDVAHWYNALFFNPALLSTTAQWGTNAGYIKYTETNVGDSYEVLDFTTTTYDASPSPVATGTTIAALMTAGGIVSSADSTTYTLSNGSVSTINGVTTYVATAVRPNQTTAKYHTFYELGGNVYSGQLIKDGTVLGGSSYRETVSGTTVTNYSLNFQIRLNKAANDSIQAALTF